MDFVFADDARQGRPSRQLMGPLVAIGGVHVPGETVGELERAIQDLCAQVGFPSDEQFKWSPGKRETFMRANLKGEDRVAFYRRLFSTAQESGATAFVVIEDVHRNPARSASATHEDDVTALFMERADNCLRVRGTDGLVVVAKPSGGAKDEEKFLANCVELRREGTAYSSFHHLPLGVVTAPSRHVRLLQLADVVASCTTARVSGESDFSPEVFDMIRPILRREGDRIGGVGLKLHPDFVYANLYHWLVGDAHYWRGNIGTPLPLKGRPYSTDPGEAAHEL